VTVRWPGAERSFAAGERIHTENSYKYTLPRLTQLLRDAGYTTVRLYTDAADRFALALAQ
jgi:L-histidine Nalpha-methyltransferase